jgi:hypothetical protein
MNFYHFKTGNKSPLSQLSLSLMFQMQSINFFFFYKFSFSGIMTGRKTKDRKQQLNLSE